MDLTRLFLVESMNSTSSSLSYDDSFNFSGINILITNRMSDNRSTSYDVNNNQNNDNSSPLPTEFSIKHINWYNLFLILVILVTIVGNLLVVLAVLKNKSLQNTTNFFLMSLAITDFLVAIVVMPLNMTVDLLGYFPFGFFICNLWVTCDILLCTSSIWHMCIISMDRFFTIRFPLKYGRNKTRKYMLFKIVCVWLLSIVICFPMFILGVINKENVFNSTTKECALQHAQFKIYGSILAFYIPLCIIAVTYSFTMKALKTLMNSKEKNDCYSSTISYFSNNNNNRQQQQHQKTSRLYSFIRYKFLSDNTEAGGTNTRTHSITNSATANCYALAIANNATTTSASNVSPRASPSREMMMLKNEQNVSVMQIKSTSFSNQTGNSLYLFRKHSKLMKRRTFSLNESYLHTNGKNPMAKNRQQSLSIRRTTTNDAASSKLSTENTLGLENIFQKYFSETNLNFKYNNRSRSSVVNSNDVKIAASAAASTTRTRKKSTSFKSKSDFHVLSTIKRNRAKSLSLLDLDQNQKGGGSSSKESSVEMDDCFKMKFKCSFKLRNTTFKRSNKDKIKESKKLQKILANIEREMDAFLLPENEVELLERKLSIRQNRASFNSNSNSLKVPFQSFISITPSTAPAATEIDGNKNNNKKFQFQNLFKKLVKRNNLENDETKDYVLIEEEDKRLKRGFLVAAARTNNNSLSVRDSLFSNSTNRSDSTTYSNLYKNSINSSDLYSSCAINGNSERKNSKFLFIDSRPQKKSNSLTPLSSEKLPLNGKKGRSFDITAINSTNKSQQTRNSARQRIGSSASSNSNNKYIKASTSNSYQVQTSGFFKANNERKAVKVLIIIFVIFVVLWTPFFVVNTLTAFCQEACKSVISFMGLFTWLGFISSSVNPIIYTVFNKSFRKAFIALLTCKTKYVNIKRQRLLHDRMYQHRKSRQHSRSIIR